MESDISIGLHSQTLNNKSGIIAGSEITTRGLMDSFSKLPFVKKIYRYAPGRYNSLSQDKPDLMVIEGWDRSLPEFISRVRKHSPGTIILYWCLSFFGFKHIVKFDVDGYLCNSRKVSSILNKIAPSKFVMLAADPDRFMPDTGKPEKAHRVVFLGMYHHSKSDDVVNLILKEAIPYGLSIFGYGWDKHPFFKACWKGVLPTDRIPELYNSAEVVLGMTEDRQRRAGMINNRVFEALSCGACFISEYSTEMEKLFGDVILFSEKPGDTGRILNAIFSGQINTGELSVKGRNIILNNHTYDVRVQSILKHYWSLL